MIFRLDKFLEMLPIFGIAPKYVLLTIVWIYFIDLNIQTCLELETFLIFSLKYFT